MDTKASRLLLASLVIGTLSSHAVEVNFPDPNLEAAIRDAIGKPTGPIDDTDLVGVGFNVFDGGYSEITDLTGLDFATDLDYIGLYSNNITDLTPIQNMPNLQFLDIGQNNVSDISPLSTLPLLQQFFAYGNFITDFSPLIGLSILSLVDLTQNPIATLTPAASMPALMGLYVSGSAINDLGPLSGLMDLISLSVTNSNVSSLAPLSGLPELQTLLLNDNQITSLAPLATVTTLETLLVRNNPLSGLATLPTLPALRMLSAGNIGLVDLSPLTPQSALKELHIDLNNVTDLDLLSTLTNMESLLADGNQIADLTPVSNMTLLRNLFVGQNLISDLSPIAGLNDLIQFSAPNCLITDPSFLAGLVNLSTLDLNSNAITDISTLVLNTGLGTGDYVYLRNNPLSQNAVCSDIPVLEGRGVNVDHTSTCTGPLPPPTIDCPMNRVIDDQGHLGYDYVGLDWVKDDANMDGVIDRWQVGLISRVMCAPGHHLYNQARAAYLFNLAVLQSEPNPSPHTLPQLLVVKDMLAALLATSEDGRDYVTAALGLQGNYMVVTSGAKTPTEPFSGAGDLDGDGTSNVEEFDNVIAMGGDFDDFLFSALSTTTNGSLPLPAHSRTGLGACVGMMLALGLWVRRRRTSQSPEG